MDADSGLEFFNAVVKVPKGTIYLVCQRLCPGVNGLNPKLQTLAISQTTIGEFLFTPDEYLRIVYGSILGPLSEGPFLHAAWDSFSSSLILATDRKVRQLAHDNTVHLISGSAEGLGTVDGSGTAARFEDLRGVASDGAGHIYLAQETSIRKLRLPATFQGAWQLPPAEPAAKTGAAGPRDDVIVTTLPFEAEAAIQALAYVPGAAASPGGSLLFATETALYRVALAADGDPAAGAQPELLAGSEEERGLVDGIGSAAQFLEITGLAVDANACVYIADQVNDLGWGASIRKVTPSGAVTTLIPEIHFKKPCRLAILPSGHLALAADRVVLIDLKLQAPPLTASAAPPPVSAGPPPRSLPADLGALLDRQPDATSDVTLLVGGRSFAAHRGILAARSDYFRQRLEGDFADGSAAQLSLPDADPEIFAVVLRFIYTGHVSLPGPLARSVAELADRLLLPELCREAQARVLANVTAESVVDSLLWAESRGGSFAPLLADLKAWYLGHEREVMARARLSIKRLAVESPDLMFDLHEERGKRARLW